MNQEESIRLTVGGVPVDLRTWSLRRAINDRASASTKVALGDTAVDFTMDLSLFEETAEGGIRKIFDGQTTAATFDEDACNINGVSAVEMTEMTLGAMSAFGLSRYEQMYTVARIAGFDEAGIQIDIPPDVETEEFLVQIPVEGVVVDQVVPIGRVELVPVRESAKGFDRLESTFRTLNQDEIDLVASVVVESDMLIRAEQLGNELISAALDALLASNLYALSRTPSGKPLPFTRERMRARPRPRRTVLVKGLRTKRAWVRNTENQPVSTKYEIDELLTRWPELSIAAVPEELKAAFADLRKAADESLSPLQRNQALWNVAEFYAAKARPTKVLSKGQIRSLAKLVDSLPPNEFDSVARSRIRDVVGRVNSRSLLDRLFWMARSDRAPISESENALLKTLRASRNDAAHGRSFVEPTPSQLTQASSVMARLLMFRWASLMTVSVGASDARP